MTCYKPTQGCGVYEYHSCFECPYSEPPKITVPLPNVQAVSIEDSTIDRGRECQVCGNPLDISLYDIRQFCPECLKRLNRILYPERKQNNENN